eukprot:11848557-Alexandrium_andersonii.AAC.1
MSASLVGSEMCIRDRPRRAAGPAPGRGGPLNFSNAGRAGSKSDRQHVLCLLYTSDAADDM